MKIKFSVLMLYLGIIVSAIVSGIVATKLNGTLQTILVSFGITFLIESIFFLIGMIIEIYKEIKDDEDNDKSEIDYTKEG